MLIEFSIKNFLSIREKVTLSMASNYSDEHLSANLIPIDLPGLDKIRSLVKTAAIYGANASGKTNLVAAARFFKHFILSSATELKPDDPTGVTSFRLSSHWKSEPSEFECIFVANDVRYHYGVILDSEKIHWEALHSCPEGKKRKEFVRTLDYETNRYTFQYGSHVKKRDKSLEEKTRQNALFLSVGAQFNNAQLTEVYRWFSNSFQVLSSPGLSGERGRKYTADMLEKSPKLRELFVETMKAADIGIDGINIHPPEELAPDFLNVLKDEVREKIAPLIESIPQVRFLHHGEEGEDNVEFDFNSESAGTQRLFSLLGYWHDTLQEGICVFVDEIDHSLHSLLSRFLIMQAQSEQLNKHGAQVVFTTHDTTLLDSELLRRDQVWFTEKDDQGNTSLTPLSDYRARKNESFQRGYLAGRYGGIPMIEEPVES